MARRAAAQQKTEPASLPEVPIPLSEVPEHQRAAYELEVINNPEMFRKILSNENFFEMIAAFPDAWWGDRLSMYLYRHESDDGLMVKNPQGEGNYIKPVIRQPIDRDWIANRNGGGKYQLWLNLSSPNPSNPAKNISTTVRKYTFRIDGPPNVKEGQIIEIGGKPVSVSAAPAASADAQRSDVAQALEASSEANRVAIRGAEQVMEIGGELLKKQLGLTPAVENKFQDRLLEILLTRITAEPKAPAADPVQQELMKAIIAKAFAAPPPNPEPAERQTPLNDTLAVIKDLTGAESIAELMRPAARAVVADVTPAWVSPLLQLGQTLIQAFPAIMAQSRATRDLEFRRMLFLRDSKPGQAVPQTLIAEVAPPAQPAAQSQPSTSQANGPMQPQEVVQGIITMICHGFDRDTRQGYETAAAIAFNYGDAIDSLGFGKTLGSEAEVAAFIAGLPPLQQRSQDVRWPMFQKDFLNYSIDRWGTDEEQERWESAHADDADDEQKPPAA